MGMLDYEFKNIASKKFLREVGKFGLNNNLIERITHIEGATYEVIYKDEIEIIHHVLIATADRKVW